MSSDIYSIAGRLCEMTETNAAITIREQCGNVSSYQSALATTCDEGSSGVFTWTPQLTTPDTVYYQVSVVICSLKDQGAVVDQGLSKGVFHHSSHTHLEK